MNWTGGGCFENDLFLFMLAICDTISMVQHGSTTVGSLNYTESRTISNHSILEHKILTQILFALVNPSPVSRSFAAT